MKSGIWDLLTDKQLINSRNLIDIGFSIMYDKDDINLINQIIVHHSMEDSGKDFQ